MTKNGFDLDKEVSIRLTFDILENKNEVRGVLRYANSEGIIVELDYGVKCLYFFSYERILFMEQTVEVENEE